jgi:branched-chain amino acid transport system ATP-binding protein
MSRRVAMSCRSFPSTTTSSLAASRRDQSVVKARVEIVMDQFPMLREFRNRKAMELAGGQQKQLEVARSLLLDPKLILIDEPSIGLSPNLVQEVFATLKRLSDAGVTVLMVEQNAKAGLAMSDYGLVLKLGQTRMHDRADKLLNDARVGQLFLGGHGRTLGGWHPD